MKQSEKLSAVRQDLHDISYIFITAFESAHEVMEKSKISFMHYKLVWQLIFLKG